MINSSQNESEGTLNLTSAEQGSRHESWINLVVGCILLITTSISLFTNGTVLYVFFTRPQYVLTRINSYMAVVCLLAFIMASLGYPMVVSSSFAGYWLFGETGCVYYGFLTTCCGLCTMFILTLISVDQYISVVHRKFNEQSINLFSIIAISGSLLMSLVIAVGPLVGWNKYVLEGIGTTCSMDLENADVLYRSYLVTLLFVAFFLPVSGMMFCYWKIFSKVNRYCT
ncbi:visual pigment-like receptor peropsin [Mytilus trossulus]|uniref:visual pigment-like receptor peropsin n=1 Tax=Mytilus trossulus TaxID=6551 RepID=UPI00300616F4